MNDLKHSQNGKASRQRATLADVAMQAGVSKVAVSMVLNGSRTGTRVSAATRERIERAAMELEYWPNAVARSLRQKRTDIIAFYDSRDVAIEVNHPFLSAILAGMQEGCELEHKDLLIHGRFRQDGPDDLYLALLNGQIDGLVLYARTLTPLIKRLADSRLPVVCVAEEVSGVPFVGVDETGGSRMLARYLAAKGYRQVLYRRSDETLPSTLCERVEAFCDEALALGMALRHSCNPPTSNEPTPQEQEMLLAAPEQRPDVVVCWNDSSAAGIARFCLERGLRVPQDLAIAGFDDLPSSYRPTQQLTTIAAPWAEVARTAVKLLVARCQGQEVPPRTVVPVQLIEGRTT